MLRSLALASALLFPSLLPAVELQLPTENHQLFTGEPEKFYMYVDRTFEGETTKPWEAGSFGFVRTPIRVGQDVVLTKNASHVAHNAVTVLPPSPAVPPTALTVTVTSPQQQAALSVQPAP